MTKRVKHYHMYGELNVTFVIGEENNVIYLPCYTSLDELSKRFLQSTHKDPKCYTFYSNEKRLTNETTLFYVNENPLDDFIIKCKRPSKSSSLKKFKVYFNSKKKLEFETSSKYINPENIKRILAQYFSLDPKDFTIEKDDKNNFLVKSDHILTSEAEINKKSIELTFSDKSTALDLKYLASVYDPKNCSRLYINKGEKESLNRKIVSKKLNPHGPNKLTFRPYKNNILYRENVNSEIKETTFDGAPIGRNIVRAIAKATKLEPEEASHKILMVEVNGVHSYKVLSTKFVKLLNDPFILLDEVAYKFEIHRGDKISNQEICLDPQFQIVQLPRYLSNLPGFVPYYFLKIKNSKGRTIDENLTVKEASKKYSKFIVEIEEPHPVEATFRLYGSEDREQKLKVDPTESSLSVIKTLAEKYKISPSYVHLFLNGFRVPENRKFIDYYYGKDNIYNISSELYIQVKHGQIQKQFIFPLNIDFDFLAAYCKQKFEMKEIGFIDTTSNDTSYHTLVYSTWEKEHIFPGTQYVARYQKIGGMKAQFLIVSKDEYEKDYMVKPSKSSEEVELDILVYTKDGRLESKVTKESSEKIKFVVQEVLTEESQEDVDSAIFFVSEHELKPNSTIFDVKQIFDKVKDKSMARPKLVVFSDPHMYLYKLPGKNDFQFIIAEPTMNIYDLRADIRKSSQMIIVKYDEEPINNLSQPVVFYNSRKPFLIEFVKDLSYTLVYQQYADKKYESKISFDGTTTIFNVLKESCDFLNKCEAESDRPRKVEKSTSKTGKGAEKAVFKTTQIRVMINSIILTKEMEKELLVNDFGLTGEIDITPLEKVGISIQGDNLHFFYFSENDTVLYVKKTIIRRLDGKEEDTPYYFLVNNQVALNDDDRLSEFIYDENFELLDLVPIQDIVNVKAIFPEFTTEFKFIKDIIMYDIKEYFAKFYKIDDPDLVSLTDQATEQVIDENDSPTDDQVLIVKFDVENLKLDKKYVSIIEKFKEDGLKMGEEAEISENSFKCPFTYKFTNEFDFDLIIYKTHSAKNAKLHIAKYLSKLDKDKVDEQVDPDELMITINNKEVYNNEILYDKYKSASKSNPAVRFIVNKEVLDMDDTNLFLATTCKNPYFGSYEIF